MYAMCFVCTIFIDVISDCTAALRCSHSVAHFQSKTTSKLYYRRAKALEMIGDADGAVNDMKKVLELEVRRAKYLYKYQT